MMYCYKEMHEFSMRLRSFDRCCYPGPFCDYPIYGCGYPYGYGYGYYGYPDYYWNRPYLYPHPYRYY